MEGEEADLVHLPQAWLILLPILIVCSTHAALNSLHATIRTGHLLVSSILIGFRGLNPRCVGYNIVEHWLRKFVNPRARDRQYKRDKRGN